MVVPPYYSIGVPGGSHGVALIRLSHSHMHTYTMSQRGYHIVKTSSIEGEKKAGVHENNA